VKLSFVIPAYNEEKYLGACLSSILEQIKQHPETEFEVIVVNNASTDSTRDVAQKFENVKIIDEPKKGLVMARNTGFNACTGELIANIDSDSILTPGWITRVLEEFKENKKLAALSGPFIYYDLPVLVDLGIWVYYYLGFLSHLFNQYILRVGALLQGGNIVMSRDYFNKIGGYNLNLIFWGEDIDLARRLSKVGQVKFTFSHPIYSSARRLKNDGVLKMMIIYPMNYLSTTFLKKPYHNEYKDIRYEKNPALNFKTTTKSLKIAVRILQICLVVILGLLIF
jgi:glycosyltransferase involved in cell wall biosynthesis